MLTQKNQIRRSEKKKYRIMLTLFQNSKNLYNRGLYLVRQEFFKSGSYFNYDKLYHMIKSEQVYKQLPSQVAQQTLKVLHQNFRSFFELLKLKESGKYTEKVRIPGYLESDGLFLAIFPRDMFRVLDGSLRLSLGNYLRKHLKQKYLFFSIPTNIPTLEFNQIRLLPKYRGNYIEIEYLYEHKEDQPELDSQKYMEIDLGLNNFASCYGAAAPFIIEGSGIVSYNRWYNKAKSKLQSTYDHLGVKEGKEMDHLLHKREMVMNNFMNQAVSHIVKNCIANKIGNLVVGDWDDMKRGLKMQKKTAQQFQQIPYKKFKDKLKSKCERYGVNFVMIEESYTSRTCSGCGVVRKANRKYRGLYVCNSCGLTINADINAALNIIRNVAPKYIGSSGGMITPVRIRVID